MRSICYVLEFLSSNGNKMRKAVPTDPCCSLVPHSKTTEKHVLQDTMQGRSLGNACAVGPQLTN